MSKEKKTYQYTREDSDEGYMTTFESYWDTEFVSYVAEEAAKHAFDNGDWGVIWPQTFSIFNMDDIHLGTYEIELEHEPIFHASSPIEGN